MKSPPPCPATVTVRRNPSRKARATPSSALPLCEPLSSPSLSRNIFSTEVLQNPNNADIGSLTKVLSENLKVFLRIRPLTVQKKNTSIAEPKNIWPKNKKIKGNSRPKIKKSSEICVQVNDDLRSVTVSTPQQLQEMKRVKSEVYEGFSRVFASEVSQADVYEEIMKPLVEDFLKGKSGMLAAMGPSGSGKTHTVFGCTREPGMVPLTLRRIFSENESNVTHKSRVFFLSMFEISLDKGKTERMVDLLHDGGDISMQQSVIKGIQEAVVFDAQQAESLIAQGMLKRSTALTNSNSQSSRSQCIINIRWDSQGGEAIDTSASCTVLTIVDLAGAEREKKTGNQGARLIESNFINNTSMVFGQCLRSLLEHQRNRNKPLQKHYKNSLLTRYLQEYLEGKKRMSLILTVKPGLEDYLDTSFLLRQASPFTKIKFNTVEDPVNLTCNKRPNQAMPQPGQHKKMKFKNSEVSSINERNVNKGLDLNLHKDIAGKVINGCLNRNVKESRDENINQINVRSDRFAGLGIQEKLPLKGDYSKPNVKKDREYHVMQGLSKALWTVLKQYKEKLEGVEMENCRLRESFANEKERSLDLENELTREKMRLFDLENKLKELKSRCTCRKASADVFPVPIHDANLDISQYQLADLPEDNTENSSLIGTELERTEYEKKTYPSARDSVLTFVSCSGGLEEHFSQQQEGLLSTSDDAENTKGLKDTREVDSRVFSTRTNSSQDLSYNEDMGTVDMPSGSQPTNKSIKLSLDTSHNSEQDAIKIAHHVKNLESESECALNGSFAVSECDSANSIQVIEDAKLEPPTQFENLPSRNQATSWSTSGPCTNLMSEEDPIGIAGDVKNLEPERECVSSVSCFANALVRGSAKNTQESEDLRNAEEPTQFEIGVTDDGLSLVEDRIVPVAAHSDTALNSSISPLNTCYQVDEPEPLVIVLPEDAKSKCKFLPEVDQCSSNFQLKEEKPKRRLQPASSVLLKDISLLKIKDESDKPKGGRVGKRGTMDDRNRTQGVCWKHLFIEVTRLTLHLLSDHFITQKSP